MPRTFSMSGCCSLAARCPVRIGSRAITHRLFVTQTHPRRAITPISSALNEDKNNNVVYQGMYGPWSITEQDLIEVWTYRVSISIIAVSFALGTALSFAPGEISFPVSDELQLEVQTALTAVGATALGVALLQIHIYVTPLKRMLQLFWLLGVLGGGYLIFNEHKPASFPLVPFPSLPAYVATHPNAVWFIGPAFAALTGLTFKEGVCYGKAEAFALTLLIPILLLGHLVAGNIDFDRALAVVISSLLLVFAARKYTQPVKDDIGDGSVFKYQKANRLTDNKSRS